MRKIDTKQENEINQQHSQQSHPKKKERRSRKTKLKALHHSILVKAEFFMKHERIMFVRKKTFPINYSSMGFWGWGVIYVLSFAKQKTAGESKRKQKRTHIFRTKIFNVKRKKKYIYR